MDQPADLTIRRAHRTDAPVIAALHADSWRRHYRGAYSDEFLDGDVERDRLEVWTKRLETQDSSVATILAEHDDVFVGFVHLILDDDPEYGSLVDNLHVHADRKRRGVGTRLMSEAARVVIDNGDGALYLWVLEQNVAAQAFYEERGAIFTGRTAVAAPGGVPDRLNGAPFRLRYAWTDPAVLLG